MEQKSKIMQLNEHELVQSIQSGNISISIIDQQTSKNVGLVYQGLGREKI